VNAWPTGKYQPIRGRGPTTPEGADSDVGTISDVEKGQEGVWHQGPGELFLGRDNTSARNTERRTIVALKGSASRVEQGGALHG